MLVSTPDSGSVTPVIVSLARPMGARSPGLFDEAAGICCFALKLVRHECVDLVSMRVLGAIADTAHHLLLHDEMGTSKRNVPDGATAPPRD